MQTEFKVGDLVEIVEHNIEHSHPELLGQVGRVEKGPDTYEYPYFVRVTNGDGVYSRVKAPTKLPKYWAVQCDTSNPNWINVVDYLNEIQGPKHEPWKGNLDGHYYGYDGGVRYNGTSGVISNIEDMSNNPIIITIEEFISITSKKQTTMSTAEQTSYRKPNRTVECREKDPSKITLGIKLLRAMGVNVGESTVEYDRLYPYLVWNNDNETVYQTKGEPSQVHVHTIEDFIALFKKQSKIKINLNVDYDAVISNSKEVKVGCQTISREKVEEVLAAMKQFD